MAEVLEPIRVHTSPVMKMDDEQFFQFCQINKELRLERTAEGDIVIMSPESASSGIGNARLIYYFVDWADKNGSGEVFGSSTGFILPNGATRSPDIAWVHNERLKTLSENEWQRFLPLCPDFVLELRSPSDRLTVLQKKMEEYVGTGARLGWLLDPEPKQVHVYRPGRSPEILNDPAELSGEPVLPGFRLELEKVWSVIQRRR
jgi:Uma2 family endonuclease